ncbi:hypothetical protein P154DRAFT_584752 [Amniculicola lignicola CBS 123094]|uniref:Actin-like ATPase domain-containing protein n=1 Tax=Amniculicola lignicola CBS 123094 TaxID=1392246 RepID=A0A6A5X5G2_9PLEO|nr:hypothetical protein P154DRAFT_584752 [Amniculicola lignicola CBS 123094]
MSVSSGTRALRKPKLIIGLDFGTTYGTAAFVSLRKGQDLDKVEGPDINLVDGYKDDPHWARFASEEVPILVYYGDDGGTYHWGFSVKKLMKIPSQSIYRNEIGYIVRPKLLLDSSDITTGIRDELMIQVKALKSQGHIEQPEDILRDYFTGWLAHIGNKVPPVEDVEFSICLPTKWTITSEQKLCQQIEKAIRATWPAFMQLPGQASKPINMFTVREPEAAAAGMLIETDNRLGLGHVVLIIDAGGATIEMTAYSIRRVNPLRFAEVTETSAAVCGSDLLNFRFKELVVQTLSQETYLQKGLLGKNSLAAFVEAKIMPSFEYQTKRNVDFAKQFGEVDRFEVPGLRPNTVKGFGQLRDIFKPLLDQVEALLTDQFDQAVSHGDEISAVILAGGFAESIPLQQCIKAWLRNHYPDVYLTKPPKVPGIMIAKGAVHRALNKEYGPTRFVRSSFAILRHIPFEDIPRAKENAKFAQKGFDGLLYVKNCLNWFIRCGQRLDPGKKFEFISHHQFDETDLIWIGEEILYHCPTDMNGLFPRNHPQNEGKDPLGRIEINFEDIKNKSVIIPSDPENNGKLVWSVAAKVTVELLEGFRHNLKFQCEWTPKLQDEEVGNLNVDDGKGGSKRVRDVRGGGQVINIVAHFAPSTA